MAGYQRQDTTGQLANGNPIDADIFNDEYDAIESAFNASSGHTHDGSAGGGAPIESIGPSQELEVTSSAVFPKNDNLIDNGKSTLRWRNGYYGTDLQVGNDLTVSNDTSITGNLTVNGNTTLGDAATDTVTVNADVASNLIPDATGTRDLGTSTMEWNDLYLDGTATVDTLDVDENANIDGTLDVAGDVNLATGGAIAAVAIVATTGNMTVQGNTIGVGGAEYASGQFNIDSGSGDTTISADLDVTGATGIDGDFDINTNKFTVAAATGNTTIAGTLDVTGDMTVANLDATSLDLTGDLGVDGDFDVNTNKFTVAGATGNTTVAGTLDVTGNQTNTGDLTVNGNTTLGDAATDTVTITADVASNIIPDANNTRTLGDASNNWSHVYANAVTTVADVTVGGDVAITGDLTVSGTTTTVNSTTVDIADVNITLASGAATAAAADGSGITVAGASATLTYDATSDRWDMNKDLEVANVYADLTGDVTGNVTGTVDGIVGGTTPAAGTFTTLEFSTSITDGTTTITGFADEDDMTSDSAALIPTQQSVKAYVDNATAGGGDLTAATLTATDVDLNGGDGSGWVIYQSGTDLKFKYNGTDRFKLSSTGALVVENDVTAYGAA